MTENAVAPTSTSAAAPGTTPAVATADPTNPASAPVTVVRESHRRYTGYSPRGGVVRIGDAAFPDTFTPGELLKVALGACAAMSSDAVLSRRLGEDFPMTVVVDAEKNVAENRYTHFVESIRLDLDALDEATRGKVLDIMGRAIDQACTVGKTIEHGATIDHAPVAHPAPAVPAAAAEAIS